MLRIHAAGVGHECDAGYSCLTIYRGLGANFLSHRYAAGPDGGHFRVNG